MFFFVETHGREKMRKIESKYAKSDQQTKTTKH